MKHTASPKDVFLQLFSTAMLYLSLIGLFTASFSLINFFVEDSIGTYVISVQRLGDLISFPMAMLIVAFPLYIWTLLLLKKRMKEVSNLRTARPTLWLTNLTLFLAAIIITITAITVVFTFFDGELSLRFALKSALVLLLTILTILWYRTKQSSDIQKGVAAVSVALVLIVIVTGILSMGSPQQRRFAKADETTRQQLLSAFYEIESSINIYDATRGVYDVKPMPNAITLNPDITYSQISNTESTLCTEFLTMYTDEYFDSELRPKHVSRVGEGIALMQPDWSHVPGENCFTIEIEDEDLQ